MESFWAPNSLVGGVPPHPRQVRFEARRVRDLLAAFGLVRYAPEMMAAYGRYWGERRLTFEGFHDLCPTFPFMLEGQSVYGTAPEHNEWARLGTWMTRFHRTFVFQRYA